MEDATGAGTGLGRTADALTAGRLVLSVPLGAAAAAGWWNSTTVLLVVAWWSDFLDGRLARRSSAQTRLGDWDLAADTAVGAGLLAGLAVGGHVPALWAAAGALLGLGFLVLRNPALGMLLQAIAYGPTLWLAARHGRPAFILALATIAVIAVLDVRRLFDFLLPAFFRGVVGRRNGPH